MNVNEFKIFTQKRHNWDYVIAVVDSIEDKLSIGEPILITKESDDINHLAVAVTTMQSEADAFIKVVEAKKFGIQNANNIQIKGVPLKAPTGKKLAVEETIKTPELEAGVKVVSATYFVASDNLSVDIVPYIKKVIATHIGSKLNAGLKAASSMNVGKQNPSIAEFDELSLDDVKNMFYDSTLEELDKYIIIN